MNLESRSYSMWMCGGVDGRMPLTGVCGARGRGVWRVRESALGREHRLGGIDAAVSSLPYEVTEGNWSFSHVRFKGQRLV